MGYLRGKAHLCLEPQCVVQDLNIIHVSLNELMNGCPISRGKKTGNVIQSVANIEKKKCSTDSVISMFAFLF